MAVAFDNVGPSASGINTNVATSLTWTHNVISGPDTLVLAAVSAGINTSDAGLGITATYAGTTMPQVGSNLHANNGTTGFIALFKLTGVATGNGTVIATVSGASAGTVSISAGSLSFNGVNQSTPLGTPATAPTGSPGNATTASVAVASNTSGNIIAGFACDGSGTTSATSPSTSRWIANNAGAAGAAGNNAGATSPATGSSVTMAWTITNDWWAAIAAEVLPVASPGISMVGGSYQTFIG